MNSREITNALVYGPYDLRRNFCVPNVKTGLYAEADLLVIRPSGWVEEVEIKVSKSDFRREFTSKSSKHDCLTNGRVIKKYCWTSKTTTILRREPYIISRFWFAMPLDLAESLKQEIPAHAGLYGVGFVETRLGPRANVTILKPAPRLSNCRKCTDAEKADFLRLGLLRYWDIRHKESA